MASPATVLTGERLRAYSVAADKALAQVKSILETRQKELEEYDSLINRLEEMPKKRSEAVMCPIGSVGFLPATIVHTNEILVGLGDGYFVDASAYQAAEILKRRRTVLEKNIDDLHQHENIISQQIAFAKELFEHQNTDEVEIREEYDEEREEELRKKRRSRTSAKRHQTKTVADIKAEAEMMKRLEELEQQELQNGELDHDTDDFCGNDSLDIPQSTTDENEGATRSVPSLDHSQSDQSSLPLKPSTLASSSKYTESSSATCSKELGSEDATFSRKEKPDPQVIDKTVEEDGLSVGVFSGQSTTDENEGATRSVPSLAHSQSDESSLPLKPSTLASSSKYTESSSATCSKELGSEDATFSRKEKPDPQVIDKTVEEDGLSVGVFSGEDLIKALTEQNQMYDGNNEACRPPRGVDPKEFQKLLKMVEDMSCEDSSSDRISEEGGEDGDVEGEEGLEKEAERSELDSDDLSQPEMGDGRTDRSSVKIGKFVVQNLGPNASAMPTKSLETQKALKEAGRSSTEGSGSSGIDEVTNKETRDNSSPDNDESTEPSETRSCELTAPSQSKKASILLNADEKSPINKDEVTKLIVSSKTVLPGSKEAFSGVIKERNVEVLTTSDVPAATTQPSSSKPQSLFRMKRLQNSILIKYNAFCYCFFCSKKEISEFSSDAGSVPRTTLAKKFQAHPEALDEEPQFQIDARKMASILKGDPRVTVIMNYERDCVNNSAAAAEKVNELAQQKKIKKRYPQSVRTSITMLDESLAKLPTVTFSFPSN
ncbi:prefoldin, alpha subunit, partial [Ostertagia ostertagi]